jgi:carotenoid 1,2-hydratase
MDTGYAQRNVAAGTFRGASAVSPEMLRGSVSLDDWSPLWTGLARVGGLLEPAPQPASDPWALLRGPDRGPPGRALCPTSRRMVAEGPRFDCKVAPGGYAWWYIDATSADGAYGLTLIAFVGSVFSPYYKLSGRHSPDNHCAINISLNGPRGSAWAMTERTAREVDRSKHHFSAGPSAMRWDGETLVIDIAEVSAPLPYKVRGTIRVSPEMINTTAFALDPAARHRWHPVAPRAHVEVNMTDPGLRWSGAGYFDSNFGDEALEDGFADWHWSRAHLRDDVAVLYEGLRRDGTPFDLALRMDRSGQWHDVDQPASARLPRSGWMINRVTRADAGFTPRVVKTWVDAPFYARSQISTRLFGETVDAVHESLSMGRFRSPIVQGMLPFRMPRAIW